MTSWHHRWKAWKRYYNCFCSGKTLDSINNWKFCCQPVGTKCLIPNVSKLISNFYSSKGSKINFGKSQKN